MGKEASLKQDTDQNKWHVGFLIPKNTKKDKENTDLRDYVEMQRSYITRLRISSEQQINSEATGLYGALDKRKETYS